MSSKEIKTPSRRHGGGPGAIPEKAKDFKGSIGKLIKYIGNCKIAIFVVIIFATVATIFNVIPD